MDRCDLSPGSLLQVPARSLLARLGALQLLTPGWQPPLALDGSRHRSWMAAASGGDCLIGDHLERSISRSVDSPACPAACVSSWSFSTSPSEAAPTLRVFRSSRKLCSHLEQFILCCGNHRARSSGSGTSRIATSQADGERGRDRQGHGKKSDRRGRCHISVSEPRFGFDMNSY